MSSPQKPSLFGLSNSNRDFSDEENWGKNKFNSSFPAALCCFLNSINQKANYLSIANKKFSRQDISITDAFKVDPTLPDTYFSFESTYNSYQQYISGKLPRTDLVIQSCNGNKLYSALEIKLTTLPDHTTCELEDESKYGSELVVRPDTIVYLACSIAEVLDNSSLKEIVGNGFNIKNWKDADEVIPHLPKIINVLEDIYLKIASEQSPFLLHPIWKTRGNQHSSQTIVWTFFSGAMQGLFTLSQRL